MAGLALGSRTEHRGNVVVTFDVRLLGEIEVTPIGHALAGKGVLEILLCLGILERHQTLLSAVVFILEGFEAKT